MERTLGELSTSEFEVLVEHAIDERMSAWMIQLLDILGLQEEERAALKPEFAASLRRALEQARSGEGVDLQTFREQIGR